MVIVAAAAIVYLVQSADQPDAEQSPLVARAERAVRPHGQTREDRKTIVGRDSTRLQFPAETNDQRTIPSPTGNYRAVLRQVGAELVLVDPSDNREAAATAANAPPSSPPPAKAEISSPLASAVDSQRGKEPAGAGEARPGQPPAGRDENPAATGLDSRAQRRRDAYRYGATNQSEAAVDAALKWLAAHQFPDGGWSFNHQLAPYCNGQCRNPGRLSEARIAATALGVLPFLGAGQTYQVGRYQSNVRNGLLFLMRQMQVAQPGGGSLCDRRGGMYGHGLAAIALCEAYAMTGRHAAGWQSADSPGALTTAERRKSAHPTPVAVLAGLRPGRPIVACVHCLGRRPVGRRLALPAPHDRRYLGTGLAGDGPVQRTDGIPDRRSAMLRRGQAFSRHRGIPERRNYGYQMPGAVLPWPPRPSACCAACIWAGSTTTPPCNKACRRSSVDGALGGQHVLQLLRDAGIAPLRRRALERLERRICTTCLSPPRRKRGTRRAVGSSSASDKGAEAAGRLYFTALAAMTLEVYYRHLPLYGENAFQQGPR